MSQEITIIVMVDTKAALDANKLDGNIYMIDNLRHEGSEGECTGNLITAINGYYWIDGSQASELLLNWLTSGIGSIPPTLPRNYREERSKALDKNLLKNVRNLSNNKDIATDDNLTAKLQDIIGENDNTTQIMGSHGTVRDTGIKVLDVTGQPYAEDKETTTHLSYLMPIITDITGEAVDKGVLFPAQYGTPISINDGWYWSATADTSKNGTFAYTLHITLYKLTQVEGVQTWVPVKMTYDAHIRVKSAPKVNGFTNGAMGELPIFSGIKINSDKKV